MNDRLPARRRDPQHLLRLHDELDHLTTSGLDWRSASILTVVVGTIVLAALRLGTPAGLGIEFIVILAAAIAILLGIGIARSMRVRSLRQEIERLEEEATDRGGESV